MDDIPEAFSQKSDSVTVLRRTRAIKRSQYLLSYLRTWHGRATCM